MIKSSQKFWVVYVRYRFIPEQCVKPKRIDSNFAFQACKIFIETLLKQKKILQSCEGFLRLSKKPVSQNNFPIIHTAVQKGQFVNFSEKARWLRPIITGSQKSLI